MSGVVVIWHVRSVAVFTRKLTKFLPKRKRMKKSARFEGDVKESLTRGDVNRELLDELKLVKAGLTKKSLFAIYVIIAFVFALVVSVL
jgi:hypothetical protein